MKPTLVRYQFYALLSGLQFGWTTWLAFVVARGGNPGWAESAFHLGILLGEVPTGVLADMLGRRRSMLIGLLVGAMASFSYLVIHDTFSACLVLALSGLGGAFLSGAETALLYETAEEAGGPDLARRMLTRTSAIQSAAMAAAPLIAGWLYQQSPLAPFIGRGLLSLLTVAVVWGMKERFKPDPGGRGAVWRHTGSAVRYVLAHPQVLLLLAFSWAYNAVGALAGQFGQVYFPAVGLTMVGAGAVFSLTRLVSAVTSWAAERMSGRAALAWLRFGPLGQAAFYLLMGLSQGMGGATAYIMGDGIDGFITPALNARINEVIPSEQRATILSLESLGFSMLVSVAFPAAAYLQPVQVIYQVTGGAAIAVTLIWVAVLPRAKGVPMKSSNPEPAASR